MVIEEAVDVEVSNVEEVELYNAAEAKNLYKRWYEQLTSDPEHEDVTVKSLSQLVSTRIDYHPDAELDEDNDTLRYHVSTMQFKPQKHDGVVLLYGSKIFQKTGLKRFLIPQSFRTVGYGYTGNDQITEMSNDPCSKQNAEKAVDSVICDSLKNGIQTEKKMTAQHHEDLDVQSDVPQEGSKERASIYKENYSSQIRTYRTRFWILGGFSCLAFLQTVIWGTFGPIMDSVEYAFGWEDYIIAILQSLGSLGIVIFIIPTTWLTQTYGIRKGMLVTIFLMSLGAGIRCISSKDKIFTALAILGAAINGIGGCVALALPPMISAVWFPPQERTTSTAVGALAAQLGGVGMYLSPLLVRTPKNCSNASGEYFESVSVEDVKGDVMELMYIEFAVTVTLFLCIIIYFPNKPPQPPSISSTKERENYFASIKLLARNPQYLLVLLTYMVSFGIPVVWIAVMNFTLQCIGVDQNQTMWIGIVACLSCGVSAVIVARITDLLYGYMKVTIICLLLGSSLCFLWFHLQVAEVVPHSIVQLHLAVSGGYALEYATAPLLMELGAELAYPCSETVVGASFTAGFSSVAVIFLLLFTIPSECYFWATYALIACTSVTIIPLCFVHEKHKRSNLDRNNK